MSLETKIIALSQAIGADVKLINAKIGDLTSLPTAAKNNIVAAIAELHGLIGQAGAIIDDSAGLGNSSVTWSANKIYTSIELAKTAVKDEILDGAGEALDTLKELADALNNDPNFAATIAVELSHRVRFDAEQILTTEQRAQACTNIGVGNPERDFAADYAAAKA